MEQPETEEERRRVMARAEVARKPGWPNARGRAAVRAYARVAAELRVVRKRKAS